MVTITKKIVGQKVAEKNAAVSAEAAPAVHPIKRPESIAGKTYRIASPITDETFYVTINYVENGDKKQPFEVFINTSSSLHYEWTTAVAMLLSFIFTSQVPNINKVLENLGKIKTPGSTGYIANDGRFISSIISSIIVRAIIPFLKEINFIESAELDEFMKEYLDGKRQELEQKGEKTDSTGYPISTTVCPACQVKAVVILDGCKTCLACGDSKCGI